MCNIKSDFVTIDSRILYGIFKEISPEFNVRKTEFTGETREAYWRNIFDFKRLNTSKQKIFTGMIETGVVGTCVHYRRVKADRPIVPSAFPVTKREDEKEADPATQKVRDDDLVVGAATQEEKEEADPATQKAQDNDLIVDADPGNTNIVTSQYPSVGRM
jgi:hypothetical protein